MKQENKNIAALSMSYDGELPEPTAETLDQHRAHYERLAFDAWREGLQ